VGNAKHFLAWSADQPCMVLHELAHAYHHLVLGGSNAEIKDAYDAARKSGKYDSVLRISGPKEKSYAMTNDEEFFAELSESYFGTNDFYPFVRTELKDYDPASYELIRRLWNTSPTTRP